MITSRNHSIRQCAQHTVALLMVLLSTACMETCKARLCYSQLNLLPSTRLRRLNEHKHDSTFKDGDILYTLQPEKKSWQEAYNTCVNQGLEMVQYDTEGSRKSMRHFCGKDRMSGGACWEGNHPGDNGCTMFSDDQLIDGVDCNQNLSYLCKDPSSSPPSPSSPDPVYSPPPSPSPFPSPPPPPPSLEPGAPTASNPNMSPPPRPDVEWKPVASSPPPPPPGAGAIIDNGNPSPVSDGNISGTLREADVTTSTTGGNLVGVNWVVMTVVICGTALLGLTAATVAMVMRARRRLQADVHGQIANDSTFTLYGSSLEYGSAPPNSPSQPSQPASQRHLLASYGSQRSFVNSL